MTDAVVRLWLKVADATALTARETLQRGLGYGRAVGDIARSDLWVFRWRGTVEPRSLLGPLTLDTNLLQNPNKHQVEIAVEDERLTPRGSVWVLVSTPGQGQGMEETLVRHRLVRGKIPAVRRARLWELTLEGDPEVRRRLAEEITVVRSRKQGLLANPHVEDWRVFTEPPSAGGIAGAIAFPEHAVAG